MEDQQAGSVRENLYLSRYAYCDGLIEEPPHQQLDLIVTIPCYNEPNLIGSLEALRECNVEQLYIEVIVVINEAKNASQNISIQNVLTHEEARKWSKLNSSDRLKFHVIYKNDLPPKHAGVGLARKIAMDEATRRLEQVGKPEGVIVCFDADSRCENNYLQAINTFFRERINAPGASIYFEHPLEGDLDEGIYSAIIDYELFLRYYVNALRYAEFPYAYETIGSSMAVRSSAYQKQGGMNRRKAGEDFYFLHKIIPLGNFGEINSTRVIPSPRVSDRVPFGTGKAVNDWLKTGELLTYSPSIFHDLKVFISCINTLYNISEPELADFMQILPESVRSFLIISNFTSNLNRINNNSASAPAFLKQFYHWFDGFKVLKYVHYSRDNFYPNAPIKEAAIDLLNSLNVKIAGNSAKDVLNIYRKIDRQSNFYNI